MQIQLLEKLKGVVKGEVLSDQDTITKYSYDASIFKVSPSAVVCPKNASDIKNLVRFVNYHKKEFPELSLTPRSAGSDMSGGVLSESIVLSFTEHINKISNVAGDSIVVEPGAYYRDIETVTLKNNLVFPAYPVSKSFCGIGGMIGNNCGGEKSLKYGKADRYVQSLKVILADGNTYEVKSLQKSELEQKLSQKNYEGELYKKIFNLIHSNYDSIKSAKPKVSKNSAGYALWDVYNKESGIFDLTKLFVGSQGTLGIITEITLKLVPVTKHSEMLVIYLSQSDLAKLGKIVNTVLQENPESFETYDDHTLKLALEYFSEFSTKLGTNNTLATMLKFLPEFLLRAVGRLPKLILQVEFTGNDRGELKNKINLLKQKLSDFNLRVKYGGDEEHSTKYWLIRRDSFKLLKEKIKDKYASPFIDDFVVNPKYLPEFLPRFAKLIEKYPTIISTVAGHIGDGNFHVIPLVNLKDVNDRQIIANLSREVYDLVFEYGGTTNGEHNDGLIRTPFLKDMYGQKIYNIFLETKKIFDPLNIFNPGKKTDVSLEYMMSHIRTTW